MACLAAESDGDATCAGECTGCSGDTQRSDCGCEAAADNGSCQACSANRLVDAVQEDEEGHKIWFQRTLQLATSSLGEMAGTRRYPRYRRTLEGKRGDRKPVPQVFGDRTAPGSSELLSWRRLRAKDGFRYELRHTISVCGNERKVETEYAQFSAPELASGELRNRVLANAVNQRHVPASPETRPEPVQKAAHGDGTAYDAGPCAGGRYDSAFGGFMGWLSDVRAALGLEQFRHAAAGPFLGGSGGTESDNNNGVQTIALHDSGIDVAEHPQINVIDAYTWGCRTETETGTTTSCLFEIGDFCVFGTETTLHYTHTVEKWWDEMPAVDNGHGLSMASILVARGSEIDLDWPSTRTGMAEEAGIVVLGQVAKEDCGGSLWEMFTGPQAIEQAVAIGADLFVSANSRYTVCSEYSGTTCASTPCEMGGQPSCTVWPDQIGADGLAYAGALDDAFSEQGLLSILSSGNNGGVDTFGVRLVCVESHGNYATGLGRASHTAIPIGAVYTQLECASSGLFSTSPVLAPGMTGLERAAQLQGVQYWWSGRCENSMGPTGDGRFYPLLLGYSAACGVALKTSYCPPGPLVEDAYGLFNGSSAATATAAGAAVVLKEWLESSSSLGAEDGSNPALLRVHLLNMGDRTGFAPSHFASRGLVRHAGFGKLRLRLVDDSCYFNDGELDYRTWIFEKAGELHTIPLGWTLMSADDGAVITSVPPDISRIRICVWFELNARDIETAMDRPFAVAVLQSSPPDAEIWENVIWTYTGDEYAPTTLPIRTSSTPHTHDPHLNIAIDNYWEVDDHELGDDLGPTLKGGSGVRYRLCIWMVYLPHGPVQAHASILWENGEDLSLAENRSPGQPWSCGPLTPWLSTTKPMDLATGAAHG